MLRKFRNLDKIADLEKRVEDEIRTSTWWEEQASRQCLEIKHLESELAISDKRMEEYQATIGILVQQRENKDAVIEDLEEQREQHFEDTDLAKVKIFDLRKEVATRNKELEKAKQTSEDRLMINKDLKEKIAKQNIQLNLKKEALNELQKERANLRKWNQISKEEIGKLQEQLEAAQIDATEWEDIAKTRGDEINELLERVAFYEEVEDGKVHTYLETIAKLKEQNKRLKKGMRK